MRSSAKRGSQIAISSGACKNHEIATKRHEEAQREKPKGLPGLRPGPRGSCPASCRNEFCKRLSDQLSAISSELTPGAPHIRARSSASNYWNHVEG